MLSARETALQALLALLVALDGPTVLRNAEADEVLPAEGLLVLRDGATIEEEALLSPLSYGIVHQADVEVLAANEAARDALIMAIRTAVADDRQLGGAVEWAELAAPELDTAGLRGGDDVATALLAVRLSWTVLGDAAG